jgi:hypothetical protein
MEMMVLQALGDGKKELLAKFPFRPDHESKNPVVKESVKLVGGDSIELSAVYTLDTINLSMFVSYRGQHVATLMCRARDVAPYFAIRLTSGAFIEFYFEK